MREQRLIFGEVAELYDRHRPAYPDDLIDDVITIAGLDGSRPVLEVGAGTGKATAMFASRGIPVLAVEPSEEMTSVARRNCSGHTNVTFECSDFEHWNSNGRRFPLLFSAQAWHWVRPEAGYPLAHEALSESGILAVFWNRIDWGRCEQREALLLAYTQSAPELDPTGVMHPASVDPYDAGEWLAEVDASSGFCELEVRRYEWTDSVSASGFVGLLATISEIRLIDERRREALFAAVTATIESGGEPLALPMRTQLCLAHRL